MVDGVFVVRFFSYRFVTKGRLIFQKEKTESEPELPWKRTSQEEQATNCQVRVLHELLPLEF